MRKRTQRKGEVLREDYVNGLRKAARIIESMILNEDPMITPEMEAKYIERQQQKKSERERVFEWDEFNGSMDDTIMTYFVKFKQSMFDNLLQVVKNPVGHDIDVFYAAGNKGLYILTVDGVEMAVSKIYEEYVHFDIPPTSVKKLISSKYRGEFKKMKDELVEKLGVKKFDNAMLTKCFLVLCTVREMEDDWGDISCEPHFFDLMDDFIEKMEFYGAAKRLSADELCKANPNFTLEDCNGEIITVSDKPFDELDIYKYDPWAHSSELTTKILGFNSQGEYV